MNQAETHLLTIAQLQYQKGHFRDALQSAIKLERDAFETQSFQIWLDTLRVVMLSNYELSDLTAFHLYTPALEKFAISAQGLLKAKAEYLLAHFAVLTNDEHALKKTQTAIANCMLTQNLHDLARSMALAATLHLVPPQKDVATALDYLSKLDILVSELNLHDLRVPAAIWRAFALLENKNIKQAEELIWRSYEYAQMEGQQLALPAILAQLAEINKLLDREDLHQLYAELALRAVHPELHPRMYAQITQRFNLKTTAKSSFDLSLDETRLSLREKDLGVIDFRNQHILLDLAVLFLKNPGIRFSKENLITTIWNSAYDPNIHDNLIYVSIKRLRQLMEPNAEAPKYILRDRKGYYLNSQAKIQLETAKETNL